MESSKKRSSEDGGRGKGKAKAQRVSVGVTLGHLNPHLLSDATKETVRSAWQQQTHETAPDVRVLNEPFTCCVLDEFIQELDFVESLTEELQQLGMEEKNNDLYTFHQSGDLGKVESPCVQGLRKLLYSDFRGWVQDVTGIRLDDKVDMACSIYNYGDVLLCHDDELEGRRIAFILYLTTPSWAKDDGGTLDLFNRDENGQPKDVAESILPGWNRFAFFEVTPISFHQVSEVLTTESSRLSISGWFHGESVPRPKPWIEPKLPITSPEQVDELMFAEWINCEYLKSEIQESIREKFENDSEICLQDFLNPEPLQMVTEALQDKRLSWTHKGPANRRSYHVQAEELPDILNKCRKVLRSEAMFLLLSKLTGLTLHPDAGSGEDAGGSGDADAPDMGKCSCEWQRWQHGSYTMIHDHEQGQSKESELDVSLFFNCEDWEPEFGGYTAYVAKEEEEELLTVFPSHNALALVYRDKDTLRFIKYINHRATQNDSPPEFHALSCIFYEAGSVPT